jgi:phosphoglucosamine mutase
MQNRGAIIGGEDSGHLIFLDRHNTGDGMITALQVLAVMREEGRPLSELARIMTVFPQTLINVAITRKANPATIPELVKIINEVENKLGAEGRVLVRYSGTQNLCRVMVEGPNADLTERYCRQIAAVAREKLA